MSELDMAKHVHIVEDLDMLTGAGKAIAAFVKPRGKQENA